jgi:hypothetical protein
VLLLDDTAATVEDVEDRSNPAAACLRSEYWMLQRTYSFLALVPGLQLVRRGQQASAVPSARLVQGTELGSLQAEAWST